MGGVWVQFLGGQGARARIILVLRECIWNAPAVSLALPAYDDAGSLGSPRRVVFPHGSTLGDCLPFPWGNRESEVKPTPFSPLLLFLVFLSFFFS